jgi:hypothetical protein
VKRPVQLAIGAAAVLALTGVASCSSLIGWATRDSRDWQFIQSVGGIAIGTPYRSESGTVFLPIECNVSGTQAITVQPTAVNSGLICAAPDVRVHEQAIAIAVRTEVAQKGRSNARCPDAELGQLSPGRYSVSYANPDGSEQPLGSIEVLSP